MSTIRNVPVNERPYEKCFSLGPQVLTDCELLSVILRTGTNGTSAYDLAGKVLNLENSETGLLSIMHLSKEQLLQLKGIGRVKAVQIMCIGELAKRISSLDAKTGLKLDRPSTIAEYYMEKMRHLEQENLAVMFLDTKCQLIKDKILTMGTVNQSLISSREIFVEGLRCNAVNIILLHNHPSGDCTPSKDDITSTLKIADAGKLIGISVLDHIIIGDRRYSSFKELKLL
ncbi:MAG: RadC family protein [Eubacterium sp.]